MNLSALKTAAFQLKNLNPTILTVVGVVGVVGATVIACRATLKAQPILEHLSEELDAIKSDASFITTTGEPYFTKDVILKKKVTTVTYHTVLLCKAYAPAVIIGVVSIGAIAGGHGILLKRNASLAAALTLTEKAYANYRKAVVEAVGEEKEKEIHFGREITQIHDTAAGTVTDVAVASLKNSPYARFFDEYNPNWERNNAYNKMFLTAQQGYANQKYQRQGWLLLNDVYEALGYEKTSAGAVVGWAKGHGDDFVDFGMYDFSIPRRQDFIEGNEPSVILDFNVVGVVWQMIGDKH